MTQRTLRLEPRIAHPDPLFKALAYLHKGLTPEESLMVDSKLLFFLINHIGDEDVVMEAIELVKAEMAAER